MRRLTLEEIAEMCAGEIVLVTTTQKMPGLPQMVGRACMLTPIQFDASVNVVTWLTTGKLAGAKGTDIELPKAQYGTSWYAETDEAITPPKPKVVQLMSSDGAAVDILFVENYDASFIAALEAAELAWGSIDEEYTEYITEKLTQSGYRLHFARPDEVVTYRPAL